MTERDYTHGKCYDIPEPRSVPLASPKDRQVAELAQRVAELTEELKRHRPPPRESTWSDFFGS